MKHLFLPYELALLAKKKGFPQYTGANLAAWEKTENGLWFHTGAHPVGLLGAPLYQQVTDWLRETHRSYFEIIPDEDDSAKSNGLYYVVSYHLNKMNDTHKTGPHKSYYEALNKAIEQAFKLI